MKSLREEQVLTQCLAWSLGTAVVRSCRATLVQVHQGRDGKHLMLTEVCCAITSHAQFPLQQWRLKYQ